jgi:hypothetical protein
MSLYLYAARCVAFTFAARYCRTATRTGICCLPRVLVQAAAACQRLDGGADSVLRLAITFYHLSYCVCLYKRGEEERRE